MEGTQAKPAAATVSLAAPAPLVDGSASPRAGAAGPAGPGVRPLSVRDFVTDASLVAVCDDLSQMTGVPIWVRDGAPGPGSSAIVPPLAAGADVPAVAGAIVVGASGGRQWMIVPEAEGASRAFALAGRQYDPQAATESAPLRISSGELGAMVMARSAAPSGALETTEHSVRHALSRLATTVSEGCEAQVALHRRVLELEALYRLSSLVVGTQDADELLRVALDLAMEVLRADAGSIALIEEGNDDLVMKANRGLSPEWAAASAKASYASEIRKAALAGEVVSVEDLAHDPRMGQQDRVRAERVAGLICTGLMVHGRAIGIIRLYTREPRRFSGAERGLLRSIADQSAAAVINARLRRLREENERVRQQVKLAANVQRRMLPRATPEIPAFDIAARYAPSFELGGDFYDFIPLGGHLGIVVGDVVGKGVPAALLMSAVRASLRAHAQDVYDLSEVLARVNAALAADTRDDEFATLWYGVVDPVSLRLTFCNAGHNPPLLVRPPGGGRPAARENIFELADGGMALGIDRQQRYNAGLCQLAVGDCLIAFTDGLVDAATFSGRRFGKGAIMDAALELLATEPDAAANRIAEHILWKLRQFTGLHARTDDVTLVVMRVRGRN